MNGLFGSKGFYRRAASSQGVVMRILVYFMVAIGLIWIGVLESASSSVKDFKRHANTEALESQRSIHRVIAVGFVGDRVVSKIVSNGRQTVLSKGNEKFLVPDPAVSIGSEESP